MIATLVMAAGAVAMLALPAQGRGRAAGRVAVGAERDDAWGPLLQGRKVAFLGNHTSVADSVTHTVDYMLAHDVDVRVLLSPEHGFRGTADAGEGDAAGVDRSTGLPLVPLYGKNRMAALANALKGMDVLVVDMQDVGARFYTYHITMLEAMEEAARQGVDVVVFDRPNPLGMVVDGPMLKPEFKSGVGRIPVPAIHGLTMGEIASMAKGEGWFPNAEKCRLTVITADGYRHSKRYTLPVRPSPNLPSMQAIYLYPGLCLFEGTPVSVGRGTNFPFQVFGHPQMQGYLFSFTPQPMPGATNPPLKGQLCHGADLRGVDPDSIIAKGFNVEYVIEAWNAMGRPEGFFNRFFNLLAGSDTLAKQIKQGMSAEEIRRSWQPELSAYRKLREKYLLYPD